MNTFSPENLRLFLIFFVPGFISMKVYSLYTPGGPRDFSKSLLEAISFSCINFAILYWLIVAIHKEGFPSSHPFLYYSASLLILFVAPITWPMLYSKILSLPFFVKRTIHPIFKPWDYFFSQRRSYWVIVHMKDGRPIGGRYDTHSFASSYPADEQVYLEEVWKLDENGRFVELIEDSSGVLISARDFELIEFFHQHKGEV